MKTKKEEKKSAWVFTDSNDNYHAFVTLAYQKSVAQARFLRYLETVCENPEEIVGDFMITQAEVI